MSTQTPAAGRPLIEILPESEVSWLRRAARWRTFQDGRMIHMRGDTRAGLSFIDKGCVRFGNPGTDGSYVVASTMGPGECFGEATLFADLPRTHEAVAVGAATIGMIKREVLLERLDASPVLARAMLTVVTSRLYGVLHVLDDAQRLTMPVRLAKHLLQVGAKGIVSLTQQQLADRLGVSRVTISKALTMLAEEDLINRGYGRILLRTGKLRNFVEARNTLLPIG
ncbi:MAG: Crp/Fnr family transcriptional regulator [Pseudomonadota bacterium]